MLLVQLRTGVKTLEIADFEWIINTVFGKHLVPKQLSSQEIKGEDLKCFGNNFWEEQLLIVY